MPFSKEKAIQLAAIALAVVAIVYVMSPARSHRGALKPQNERRSMPEIALPAVNGANWKLSEHKGKVVLVNFWATWCPPCRSETPDLVRLHDRYSGQGFTVVGIALDEQPRISVPPFLKQYKVQYPTLVPTAEFDMADAIESLPTSFLLDREGRVARTYVGRVSEAGLSTAVETLLNESARAAVTEPRP
jgi:cytochrome c biogenesis protein CcmG/thiol:disulfide interchange protein DsbE